jgi:RecQ family ATP-dependent DNA helicase
MDPSSILKNVFLKDKFRAKQEEIVKCALAGHDILVLLPTGYGKSLTYQLPAVAASSGCTIVVSPLLALIDNQVESLQRLGVTAVSLNSRTPSQERGRIATDLLSPQGPQTRLLYVSPELCATATFQSLVSKLVSRGSLNRVVIDEAHCCVEWGLSFRADYKGLGYFKQTYPHIPVTAVTATAPTLVKRAIIDILCLPVPRIFTATVNRPNLHYEVRYLGGEDKLYDLIKFVRGYRSRRKRNSSSSSGSGIIYCRTKQTTEALAGVLRQEGFGAQAFHAGLPERVKSDVLNFWISNDASYQIVVATVAFGMGVDKPDVRYVVHFDLPNSLDEYYQGSGRAGRDGRAARCILYYSHGDSSHLCNLQHRNGTGRQSAGEVSSQLVVAVRLKVSC